LLIGGFVITESIEVVDVSERPKSAIKELRRLDGLLCTDGLDPRILTDFRDALNRVRNTAWSAQQYVSAKDNGQCSASVLSLLASDRVRATYQLCRSLQTDLNSSEIQFQPGQLLQLHSATKHLNQRLEHLIEELD
jgi:hypothetical protein